MCLREKYSRYSEGEVVAVVDLLVVLDAEQ